MKIISRENPQIYIINYNELIKYKTSRIILNEKMFHKKVVFDFKNAIMRINSTGSIISSECYINSWLFFKCGMNNIQDRIDFTIKILGYCGTGSWPICKNAQDSLLLLTKLLIKYNQICLG